MWGEAVSRCDQKEGAVQGIQYDYLSWQGIAKQLLSLVIDEARKIMTGKTALTALPVT